METLMLLAAVAIYFGIIAILANEAIKHIRHIRRKNKWILTDHYRSKK